LWRMIGSPKHNSVINPERIRVKLEYKLAIKKSKDTSLQTNSERINTSLADKNSSAFWKCWNANYNHNKNSPNSPIINNLSNHTDIANSFKDYFDSTFVNSSNDNNSVKEFNDLNTQLLSNLTNPLPIDISDIEKAIDQLKLNKSPDADGL